MDRVRYIQLTSNESTNLTKQEIKDGYFWCNDCDGAIGNKNKDCCRIVFGGDKSHPNIKPLSDKEIKEKYEDWEDWN